VSPTFAPVTRRTVADGVRDAILASIREGTLAPGAALPAERVLCEQFGVARTSVREALQQLVSLGIVERRGNRTSVVELLPEVDLSLIDDRKGRVRELFETRRLIEIPMAELVTCRATPEEREHLVELAARFADDLTLEQFRALDRAFHHALSAACGNALLAEVYAKVLDRLFESRAFADLLTAESNRDEVAVIMARSGDEHRRIAAAVLAGDPVAVAAAVAEHLADVESRMIDRLV
jgi:GntR family transcriptional regulator, transcriptional repressor for pyruvate dehydrogenase complex